MNNPAVMEKVRGVFQDVFEVPGLRITPETGPGDIEDWDSVAQVKLVLALEEAFDVRFSVNEVAAMKTVGDFVRTISAKRVEN